MKILCLLVFLISLITNGQELITLEHDTRIGDKKVRSLSAFASADDNLITYLVQDRNHLTAYLYDSELQLQGKGIFAPSILKKNASIAGFVNTDMKFSFFVGNEKNKWSVLNIDFEERTNLYTEFDFKIRNERILNTFANRNHFYILTLRNKSSKLSLYQLSSEGKVKKSEIDLSDEDFSGGRRSLSTIDQLINGRSDNFATNYISGNTPLSLRSTNEKVKLYNNDDYVYLSLDNSRDYTYVIKISLDSAKAEVTTIDKESLEERSSYEDTNSFIIDDKIFLLKATYDELDIAIRDLQSQSLLNKFTVTKDEEITFNNTPILEQNANTIEDKDIKDTSTFLRKITNSKPSIAVYSQGENYIMTTGASKEINNDDEALVVMAILAGATGTIVYTMIENAIDRNYLNYTRTKTSRFQTVLGSNFTHLENDDVPDNVFDKIRSYDIENKTSDLRTLFRLNSNYYFNYYDKDEEKIKAVKFDY